MSAGSCYGRNTDRNIPTVMVLPDYTRFCHYLNEFVGRSQVTAIFSHAPGKELQVDFAGDPLHYVDRESGEQVACQVLVTALPHSHLIYCEALRSQKQEDFATGLCHALEYLQGVPQSILCDNMRTAVKRSDRYEPVFTELADQLGLHFGTTFMATRPAKPRDKASVEAAVRIVYQRIYARLRNTVSYSLEELNTHVRQELDRLNDSLMKRGNLSRRELFLSHEKPLLKALPSTPFLVRKTAMAKVQKNYHVMVGEDRHLYSVPYRYCGKKVKVIYTGETVEVYSQHQRIALHRRSRKYYGYTTNATHMPRNHQCVHEQLGWDRHHFLEKANRIGPHTHRIVTRILDQCSFVEQGYNSCMGLLRLGSHFGEQRLEAACQLLEDQSRISCSIVGNILKNNMDKKDTKNDDFRTPDNENIRGAKSYS
jgi:hypothetical protein